MEELQKNTEPEDSKEERPNVLHTISGRASSMPSYCTTSKP